MSITIGWADFEETAVVWQVRGNWSGDDFYLARSELHNLVQEGGSSINLIIDLNFSSRAPNNMMLLIRALFDQCPPSVTKVVILSKTIFWHRIFEMAKISTQFDRPMYFAHSLDEAYEYAEID